MSVNKVILLGRVGQEPKTSKFANGSVTNISLATTNRGYKKTNGKIVEDTTEWHNIVLFNKLSEIAEKFVTKGSQIYIEGELRTESYGDEGNKKYSTKIHARVIELLGGNKKDASKQEYNNPLPPQEEGEDLPF